MQGLEGLGRQAQPPERCSTTGLELAEAESALNSESASTANLSYPARREPLFPGQPRKLRAESGSENATDVNACVYPPQPY